MRTPVHDVLAVIFALVCYILHALLRDYTHMTIPVRGSHETGFG